MGYMLLNIVPGLAALLTAFFIAKSVKANVQSARMSRTQSLAVAWDNPEFWNCKIAVYKLIKPVANESRDVRLNHFRTELQNNPELEFIIANVLNYFEHVAVFIEKDIVEEEVFYDLLRGILVRHYNALSPYINEMRNKRDKGGEKIYVKLENLAKRWDDNGVV